MDINIEPFATFLAAVYTNRGRLHVLVKRRRGADSILPLSAFAAELT